MTRQSPAITSTVSDNSPLQRAKPLEGPHVTQPATTQELIADVLLTHLPNDDDAYTAADAILRDPALTVRKRNVTSWSEWEETRDALEALPEGTQIRWRTGIDAHPALAIKVTNVMGKTHWSATELGAITSESIARDNTPIEVIA